MSSARRTVVVATLVLLASTVSAAPKKKEPPAPPPEVVPMEPAAYDASGPPPAEQRRMVGILDVRVDGVPDAIKAQFERGLEEQLDTKIYWLSSRAQMRERMKFSTKWTEGCLIGQCLAELRTQTNAELVLLAAFNGSGTSFGHVVTIVRTDTGRVLSQESGRCEVCTVNEAMAEATLATLRLLNAVPDKLPDEAGDHSVAMDLVANASQKQLAEIQRDVRRRGIALTLIGLAVLAGGVTLHAVSESDSGLKDYALPIAAAGGGLLLSGVVVLTF